MNRITRWLIVAVLLASLAVVLFPRRVERPFAVSTPLPAGKVPPQLAMTWDSAALVAPDGSLWAWGGSQFGLHSVFSNSTVTPVPIRVGHESDWARVALGINFIVAIKQDGSLWSWGSNAEGAVAGNSSNYTSQPWRIGDENDWMDVRAGASHVMAMKSDRSLWIWGQNRYGQLGDGTTNTSSKPLMVAARARWKAFAPGFFNSYAIAEDGSLWWWGFSHAVGGGVNRLAPMEMSPAGKWKSISAGNYIFAAVRDDGTIWGGGRNLSSLVGANASVVRSNELVQIGSSTNWSESWVGSGGLIAKRVDGTWWARGTSSGLLFLPEKEWGDEPGMRRLRANFDPWALAAGNSSTAFLARDGTLWSAGVRMGESARMHWWDRVAVIFRRVTGSAANASPDPIDDRKPYYLWRFPDSNRGASRSAE